MAKKRRDLYAYRNKLPFVHRGKGWWTVKPTGQWEDDYEIGRQHAMAFWRVAVDSTGSCGLDLSSIILDMLRSRGRRKHSGIEVGFVRTIGELLDMSLMAGVLISLGPNGLRAPETESRALRWVR